MPLALADPLLPDSLLTRASWAEIQLAFLFRVCVRV